LWCFFEEFEELAHAIPHNARWHKYLLVPQNGQRKKMPCQTIFFIIAYQIVINISAIQRSTLLNINQG
jgi:hypothetical protein